MDSRAKRTLFVTFFVCYLGYLSNYLIRQSLSVSGVALAANGILDEAQLGIIGNAFFWIYALGRFLTGRLEDKYSPHLIIGGGMALMAVSVFFFGRFYSFTADLFFWSMNAFGQSLLWGAILRTMYRVTNEKNRTTIMALFTTCIGMGSVLAIAVCPLLQDLGGVTLTFTVIAAYTLIAAIAIFFLPATHFETAKNTGSLFKNFVALMKDRKVRGNLLPAFAHGVIKDNIIYWISLYLVAKFGLDVKSSIGFALLIPLLGIAGRLISPLVIRLFRGDEKKTMIFCFLGCAAAALPAFLVPGGTGQLSLALFAAAGLGLATLLVNIINQVLLSSFPMRYSKDGHTSTVAGIMDLAAYLGSGIGTTVYGFVIKFADYSWMFLSWIVLSGLVAVLLLLRQKRKVTTEEI